MRKTIMTILRVSWLNTLVIISGDGLTRDLEND